MGDYPKNKLGKTHEFESMKLVEGEWYCTAITDSLIYATEDKQAGRIDQETYDDRIEQRGLYAMRRKGTDGTGTSMAFMCPARGSGKTLYCPLAQNQSVMTLRRGCLAWCRFSCRVIVVAAALTRRR